VNFDKEAVRLDIVTTLGAVLKKVSIQTESSDLDKVANISLKVIEQSNNEDSLKEALEDEIDRKVFRHRIHTTTLERYGDIIMSVFQKHQVIHDTTDYCWW